MSGRTKKELIILAAGAVLLGGAIAAERLLTSAPPYLLALIYLIPYVIVGAEVIVNAAHGLIGGQFLDENFLMSIASLGAFLIGERVEAVLVMLLYRLGELLQALAVGKSRESVKALIDICPESANLETESGIEAVSPEDVHIGDVFVVRAGERVPLDGVIVEGSTALNTAALTGESTPLDAAEGDRVTSGSINTGAVIRVRAEREYEDSTASRMLSLIEGAAANKARSEKFITKFARVYTPIVVAAALLLAVLPPLLFGGEWGDWVYRALNFLVISCPCALVISVPLTFFGGIGAASRRGILVKGSNCFEALVKLRTAVFDKTGTLTKGSFRIAGIIPADGVDEGELFELAAAAESLSTHPLASAVAQEYARRHGTEPPRAEGYEELAGMGVRARVGARAVLAGNLRLMRSEGIEPPDKPSGDVGTVIHAAADGKYLGRIELEDELKPGAKRAISELSSSMNVKTVMLSGDRSAIAEKIAAELGLDEVHSELLPEGKLRELEKLIEAAGRGGTVAYVGDGINDAPVIARADVGFAMGALGSDAAIEAADVVLSDDNIERVPMAIRIAKRTVRIAGQNIVFALSVKLAVLALGALGFAEMWMALIADVGVCLLAVLNAMRTMRG